VNVLQQFAPAALSWLWQTSLAAAILAVVALLIQCACGRAIGPRWTYALWLLVVVRLMLPIAPASSFSVFNLHASRPPAEMAQVDEPSTASATPVLPLPEITVAQPPTSSPLFTGPLFAILVWLAGVAAYFSFCIVHYRRFAVWARRQTPVSNANVMEALREAQRLLDYRREITILATTTLRVPALFGFLRPRLLVPQAMLDTWSTEELRHALLHELVHARRRDHLLNWGLIIVQAVHWFNPIAHFALRRLRAERELLCDAVALSCMSTQQHHSYGAALVKAAQAFARTRISPAIVPMINHNNEVKRRVSMIAQFKPTSRLISVAALPALVLLACLTFTSKAQKTKPAPDAARLEQMTPIRAERQPIRALQHAYAQLTKDAEQRARDLEVMRHELNIPSDIAFGETYQPGTESENLRRLQSLRAEAASEYRSIKSLHTTLGQLTRKELRNAVPVATPDVQLATLMDRAAEVEQKLAALSETRSKEHPEVAGLMRTLETINRQVNERLDGLLAGLKTKVEQFKARLEEIDKELTQLKAQDLERPTRYRPYFQQKRELENIQAVRDRLQMRIIEEEINAAVSDNPGPTLKPDAPAKSQ
jgi:beta-lactamase regulating signal transducer with metallopeptidase domain